MTNKLPTAITIICVLTALFNASQAIAGQINVISPNGGEILEPEKTYEIRWQASSEINNVNIVLYRDRNIVGVIARNVPANDSKISWSPGFELPEGDKYRVGVYQYPRSGGSPVDFSDNKFSIEKTFASQALESYFNLGTSSNRIQPEEALYFNPTKNSGWFYIAQTIPENNLSFWVATVRSLSNQPDDNTAQLLYGITDTSTGKYYSGVIENGLFSESADQVNLYFYSPKDERNLLEFQQTKNDWSEFKLKTYLPWPIGSQNVFQLDKTLSFQKPILFESGDGVIPMAPSLDSLYISLALEQGFWADFQKFNVGANGSLLGLAARLGEPNHRWMSFILNRDLGLLKAGTIGVGWEILDKNNQRQPGGYTNIDLIIPGMAQITAKEEQINEVQIQELEYWQSPYKKYLKKWKISFPGIELLFETLIPNQESGRGPFRFYEGMIRVLNPQTGEQIGTGMLEQTHDENEIVSPFPEIGPILQKIKQKDPSLYSLIISYLNQWPDLIKQIPPIIWTYQNAGSLPTCPNHGCFSPSSPGPLSLAQSCGLPAFYPDQFNQVFEKRTQYNWDESGNWTGDWEEVNDATAFGPALFYQCGQASQNSRLKEMANKTVEYELSLIDKIINGETDDKTIGMALGGQYSLLAARQYYSGSPANKQKIELYSRGLAIAPALIFIYDYQLAEKSPAGAVLAISSVADYNFSLAEITTDSREKQIYIGLGNYLLNYVLEYYWKEDSYGGYYKSIFAHGGTPVPGPTAFEQGVPLSVLAGSFKFSPYPSCQQGCQKDSDCGQGLRCGSPGPCPARAACVRALVCYNPSCDLDSDCSCAKPDYFHPLSRALKLKTTLDSQLWDSSGGGYKEVTVASLKFLSSNNMLSRGHLDWYENLKNQAQNLSLLGNQFLTRGQQIADFIGQNLYSEFEGFFKHDTSATGNWYCTGCNFLTLENLHRLWQLSPAKP